MENIFSAIVATAFVICVISIGSCTVQTNERDDAAVVEMVKAGANPIAASCAVGREHSETCVAVGVHHN